MEVVDAGGAGEDLDGEGARGWGEPWVGEAGVDVSVGEPRAGELAWGTAAVRGGVNTSSGGSQTVMLGGSSGSGRGPPGTPACGGRSGCCRAALCLRGGVVGGSPVAGGSSCAWGVWVERLEATLSGTGTATSLAGAARESAGRKGSREPGAGCRQQGLQPHSQPHIPELAVGAAPWKGFCSPTASRCTLPDGVLKGPCPALLTQATRNLGVLPGGSSVTLK